MLHTARRGLHAQSAVLRILYAGNQPGSMWRAERDAPHGGDGEGDLEAQLEVDADAGVDEDQDGAQADLQRADEVWAHRPCCGKLRRWLEPDMYTCVHVCWPKTMSRARWSPHAWQSLGAGEGMTHRRSARGRTTRCSCEYGGANARVDHTAEAGEQVIKLIHRAHGASLWPLTAVSIVSLSREDDDHRRYICMEPNDRNFTSCLSIDSRLPFTYLHVHKPAD